MSSEQPTGGERETSQQLDAWPGSGGVQAPPVAPALPPAYMPASLQAQPPESGGGLAVTGLIFGILTLLLPITDAALVLARFPLLSRLSILATVPLGIIGVVLSALGLGSALRRRSAIAGLILSVLGLLFGLTLVGMGLVALSGLHMHGVPPIRRQFGP